MFINQENTADTPVEPTPDEETEALGKTPTEEEKLEGEKEGEEISE